MNTLIIVPLIIPGLITFMLLSLIIKERNYLFFSKFYKEKIKQKNNSEQAAVRGKQVFENFSDKDNTNFLDFSGGVFGI